MKTLLFAMITGLLIVSALGYSGIEDRNYNTETSQTEVPSSYSSFAEAGDSQQVFTVDADEVMNKVNTALDKKFPGEWTVSNTILQKGAYVENGNYGIVDEITKIYPESIVSLFVNQKRISGTIKGEDGKRVLEGYPVSEAVSQTMKSGKASVISAGSVGSTSYQKIYLPVKSKEETIAVLTISIAQ
ncbi:cache domain-containing protein [Phosphitispora sp. TUW77]|uniref:cache domain-containing protein n=1 Tax=Phosphitispora sp. TUW77 TaxID=3152361 RepID=UPI003AB87764